MAAGSTCSCSINHSMRWVRIRVLPLPGPQASSRGRAGWVTADALARVQGRQRLVEGPDHRAALW